MALVASSNDAAEALLGSTDLSRPEFYAAMNKNVSELGFSSMHFENPTGLDTSDDLPTNIGSARDILFLLYKDSQDFPQLIAETKNPSITVFDARGRSLHFSNTDEALSDI